jgi:hypothetical protein
MEEAFDEWICIAPAKESFYTPQQPWTQRHPCRPVQCVMCFRAADGADDVA